MKNNALQYTFKVWVTSVVVSPFLFGLILMIRQVVTVTELMDDGFRLVGMYLFLVVLQLLFSFVTWLVFLFFVNLISLLPIPNLLVKLAVFCVGILLTIGTFMAVDSTAPFITEGSGLVNLIYANCAGIGCGVWYYTLNIKTREPMVIADEV